MSQHREVLAYYRALLYLSLNKKPEALHWLEQSFAERRRIRHRLHQNRSPARRLARRSKI